MKPLLFFGVGSKTTVSKIGDKSVTIRSFGSDKTRLTLILCISSKGQKLPPLVIFKGVKDAIKEKKLKEYINYKKYKIFALCKENAWADKEIYFYWLENVFFNNKIISNSSKKILILDRATTHYDNNIIEKFNKFNSTFLLIPPGLTRYIQPLDVSSIGPLKKL